MNISLTPELENMIQEKVRTGMYHSASEVVRDALRLFQEREQLYAIRLAELRKEIDLADAEVKRGEVAPLDMDAIIAKAKARKAVADAQHGAVISGGGRHRRHMAVHRGER